MSSRPPSLSKTIHQLSAKPSADSDASGKKPSTAVFRSIQTLFSPPQSEGGRWEGESGFKSDRRGCFSGEWDVRHGSRCRSACERARGSAEGPRLTQRSWSLAPERTAPDRLASTPGTQPTTAGDWPTACQSALAPPPCPMRMQKQETGGGEGGDLIILPFWLLITTL